MTNLLKDPKVLDLIWQIWSIDRHYLFISVRKVEKPLDLFLPGCQGYHRTETSINYVHFLGS